MSAGSSVSAYQKDIPGHILELKRQNVVLNRDELKFELRVSVVISQTYLRQSHISNDTFVLQNPTTQLIHTRYEENGVHQPWGCTDLLGDDPHVLSFRSTQPDYVPSRDVEWTRFKPEHFVDTMVLYEGRRVNMDTQRFGSASVDVIGGSGRRTFKLATSITSPSGPASAGSSTRVLAPWTCCQLFTLLLTHVVERFHQSSLAQFPQDADIWPRALRRLWCSRFRVTRGGRSG